MAAERERDFGCSKCFSKLIISPTYKWCTVYWDYKPLNQLLLTSWDIQVVTKNHPEMLTRNTQVFRRWGYFMGANVLGLMRGFLMEGNWWFPKIVGFPPKSSILIGFSITNHPFWGTLIFWKHPIGGFNDLRCMFIIQKCGKMNLFWLAHLFFRWGWNHQLEDVEVLWLRLEPKISVNPTATLISSLPGDMKWQIMNSKEMWCHSGHQTRW